jgi:hypothetical protein
VDLNAAKILPLPQIYNMANKNFVPTKSKKKVIIYKYINVSHTYLLVQITTKEVTQSAYNKL